MFSIPLGTTTLKTKPTIYISPPSIDVDTSASQATFTITGTCLSHIVKIYLYSGSTLQHTITISEGSTTWSQQVTLANGANVFKATNEDIHGNVSDFSSTMTVTYTSNYVYKFQINAYANSTVDVFTEIHAKDSSGNDISFSNSDITAHVTYYETYGTSLSSLTDGNNTEFGGYVYWGFSLPSGTDIFSITLSSQASSFEIYYHRPSLTPGLKIYENNVLKVTTSNGGSSGSPSPVGVTYTL